MHFFSVVAAAATLIAGSNALFIPRNIHVADFRLYSAEGCYDGNLGVWTVIDEDFTNGECKSLNDSEDGDVPLSLSLTDINKGCTLTAYTDVKCTEGKTVLAPKQCSNNKAGFQAWSMNCDYKE
ncbi:hypothetical protein ACSS6W_004026 [Trichoderma asperelloides]|uniref:Uncharacterized protein n=1 Tax=Trichoderma asperellum TaxID=101201 RepID=A0A6V8QHM3_TRIAP|nr:hypothetical protein TASIC1_0001015300 [Trichoderma asperellum]